MAMSVKDLVVEARGTIEVVSPEEARAREGALILDVREPGELAAKGQVPGALNVPRGLLEAHADPESPMAEPRLTEARDRPVLTLCASGARAAMAAATLRRMGYERAAVIEGGLEGWRKAGLPVEGG